MTKITSPTMYHRFRPPEARYQIPKISK